MFAMAEIYDLQKCRAQAHVSRGKERPGVRLVAQARGDQVVISFEAGRAEREYREAREGVKKHPAYTWGRRSFQAANEQRERLPGALESQIIQELAAIEAHGKTQDAATLSQSASAGQEPGDAVRARQEEAHRQLLQQAEKNLTAEWRRRQALREATGWVYLPELLRYLKLGGGGEEKRFGFKPPENESFISLIFDFFLWFLALFADEAPVP
jgi:hypothetical protein